jgi:hypothetical protein
LRRSGAQLYELFQPKAGSEMSSQDHSQPFGYEFHDSFQETPTVPPPSNEPLLNMQESGFLTQFWQHTQHHSNPSDFTALSQLENQNGSNGYNWVMHEPPPTIRDIAIASIPQTPVSQHAHNMSSHVGMSDIPLSLHNDSNIEAAMLLSQSQHNHGSMRQVQNNSAMSPPLHIQRSQTQSSQSQRAYHSPVNQHVPGSITHMPGTTSAVKIEPVHTHEALVGISSPTIMDNLRAEAHSTMMSALPLLDTTNMSTVNFAAPNSAPVSDRFEQPTNPRLYQFGSDNNFASNGFQPSSIYETHEHRGELMTSELRRLKPINRTPVATREPSPEPAPTKRKRPMSDGSAMLKNDATGSSHKRKRSDVSEESDEQDGEPRTDRNGSRSTPIKRARRSSAPGSARPKRENLSDQQKRQNHIASEQKRRAQIKNGFDELNRLVPELRESGLSKSGMLLESCNFLEQLKQRNAKLGARLGLESID